MAARDKLSRVVSRRLKGFRDIAAADVLARDRMIVAIRGVYERYGYVPLETPALEYVDCLGKFLPEADQPDGGIFAFKNEDDEWVGLRYDLTAPLSRYVAMNPELPKPFRRYQIGPVWRVEKPGPGRFREFQQCDFDSVGTGSMLADAEACMVMCDTMTALGVSAKDFVVRINDRKVLNGVLESMAGPGEPLPPELASNVLRSIDKLDRVGLDGVKALLGPGRKDESGDFTKGVGLRPAQIDLVLAYLSIKASTRSNVCDELERLVGSSAIGREGVDELRQIDAALNAAGYDDRRVVIEPTVVRGLAYYTGPVFEGVLTFDIVDEEGTKRPFGSVFGGGRYDDLVERFTGQKMPATGSSLGVDRLLAALKAIGKVDATSSTAWVLVTRLDKNLTAHYQAIASELRGSGVNTELYVGTQGIGKQFKYAGDSGKIVAIVVGEDEIKSESVSIKDLRLGVELSKEIGADRKKWLEQQPAQFSAPRSQLTEAVKKVLLRYTR